MHKRTDTVMQQNDNRYQSIVEVIPDLIIKTNREGVYLEVISKTDDTLFKPGKELLGSKITDVLPMEVGSSIIQCIRKSIDEHILQIVEYDLQVPAGKSHFEARIFPLNKNEAYALIRDFTDRKRMEKEREDLIKNLRDALGQVKILKGFLPICCSCKKIRDDQGYWNQIETYIRNHSEAEFSHGICPECVKKLYPDLYEETKP